MVFPAGALVPRCRFWPRPVACLLLLGAMAWSLPAGVWAGDPFENVSVEDISRFVRTGRANRNLKPFIDNSGWTHAELQAGLQQSYQVNLVSIDRFLRSSAGERFLDFVTSGYAPRSANANPSRALRSAITKDASDGSISALGIMEALPVDFSVSGGLSICAQQVHVSSRQRTSALSYYLFLPACLHASQHVR
ncbi:MAG: alpha/beta hydrolase [Synechococcus sp. SB0673_bin_10]|nr:alpha/beta hydrolase [Synechococcus sp. SB0667_bin_8]MYG65094.1 alpha/beta hydrolase [Synechococcus sp. SB0675_bin_7]MYI71707.1 alpha/beta hydrolase [Synechococcus sp. SB0673_bin_10]MYK86681.1 alpha/beta hydrolase [Synechococcus sp. SB0669_bin_7]